jgi:hypothetical protein
MQHIADTIATLDRTIVKHLRTWVQHVLHVQPFSLHCTEHLVALWLRHPRVVCALPNQQRRLYLVYVVVGAYLAV